MAIVKNRNEYLGEIELSPEVIEVISNIAANEVNGVFALKGDFSTELRSMFGKDSYNNGIVISYEQEGLVVDVYCNLFTGVNVPKVALEIQEAVREQVYHMTEIELSEVNVHVVSIVSEKTDKNSLFEVNTEKDDK